jgi:hypothetical protein
MKIQKILFMGQHVGDIDNMRIAYDMREIGLKYYDSEVTDIVSQNILQGTYDIHYANKMQERIYNVQIVLRVTE